MTDTMKNGSVLCLGLSGFHRMHYYDWGDPSNPRVVVCVHGLSRQGRDFDFLARSLQGDFRVICPDIVGRGLSDWLAAKGDYGYPQYMADVNALIARVTVSAEQEIYWVGTSMGGLLGMLYASRRGNPVRKLVVNDAGTIVPKAALERLALYVGKDPRFASLEALEAHVRRISAPFGPLDDEQWRHITLHGAKEYADGTWGLGYDPAIALPFQGKLADVDLYRVLGCYHLPHAPAARGPVRSVAARDGTRYDAARTESEARRDRRHGTRADAHERERGAHRSRVPARAVSRNES